MICTDICFMCDSNVTDVHMYTCKHERLIKLQDAENVCYDNSSPHINKSKVPPSWRLKYETRVWPLDMCHRGDDRKVDLLTSDYPRCKHIVHPSLSAGYNLGCKYTLGQWLWWMISIRTILRG